MCLAEYSRLLSALCKDLERKVTRHVMKKSVAPRGKSSVFPDSDGNLDLFTNYRWVLATP